jgi:phosphoribosyl-ATP pyrophosphohydrolase/phosphoribosyl-AMP cyclohydrolase
MSPAAAAGVGDVSNPVAGSELGAVLEAVFQVIKERQATRPEGSYTARLFNDGIDKILKKIGEEASETIIAAKNDSRHEILYEMADLYYHTLVLLAYHGLEPGQLAAELAARR